MAKTLTIAGSNFMPQYVSNSATIKDQLQNKTNTLSMRITVKPPQTTPEEGSELIFKDGSDFLFGGFITKIDPIEHGEGSFFVYDVEASDYAWIFNNKIARKAYANQTLEYIVEDLLDTYVDSSYGFDTTNVQTGPTIESITFDHISIRKAFEKISKLTGYIWFVDYEKKLFYQDKQTDTAQETITDTTENFQDITISYDTSQVRNRVIVIGADEGQESLSTNTETFTGDGETRSWALEDKPSTSVIFTIDGNERTISNETTESDSDTALFSLTGERVYLRSDGVQHGSTPTGAGEDEIAETTWVGRDVTPTKSHTVASGVVIDITTFDSDPDGDLEFGIRAADDRDGTDLASGSIGVSSLAKGENTLSFTEAYAVELDTAYFIYVGRQGSTVGTIEIRGETVASNSKWTSSDDGVSWTEALTDRIIDIKLQMQQEPTPTEDNTILFTYFPRTPIIVQREDAASIAFFAALDGGDGAYEYTIKEDDIFSKTEAGSRAEQELEEFADPLVKGVFTTRTGLLDSATVFRAGQILTVNLPTWGISTDTVFLIQEVNTSLVEDEDASTTEYLYTVRFGGRIVDIETFLESLIPEGDDITNTDEIKTIFGTSDQFEFEDGSFTTLNQTPPFEYGPSGSPQAKWNLSEWT